MQFLDANLLCRNIYLNTADSLVYERISTNNTNLGFVGSPALLVSDDFDVRAFEMQLLGQSEDDPNDLQPRVTFVLYMARIGSKPESEVEIRIQTTVSQRAIDIEKVI